MDWAEERASKVSAEGLERLVKIWENQAARQSGSGNRIRFAVLRLLAFGLAVLSAFFGLRALGDFFRENAFNHGYWQFGLVQASLAIIFGWGALRCWRLAGSS
jgi:hypothetical protein